MGAQRFQKTEDERWILRVIHLPARIDVAQAGVLLGFTPLEIMILINKKLLDPLGNPPPNGHKFFATDTILELAKDIRWLDKATKTVTHHWRTRNQQRPQRFVNAA